MASSFLTVAKPFVLSMPQLSLSPSSSPSLRVPWSSHQNLPGFRRSASLKVTASAQKWEPSKVAPQGDRVLIRPEELPEHYIVYMGSHTDSTRYGNLEEAYLQLLSSVIPSEEKERLYLICSYSHAIRGFSAMLTEKEAALLSGRAEVVSVFRNQICQLHTTRS